MLRLSSVWSVKPFLIKEAFEGWRTWASLFFIRCLAVLTTAVFWLVVLFYVVGCGGGANGLVVEKANATPGGRSWLPSGYSSASALDTGRSKLIKEFSQSVSKHIDFDRDGFSNEQGDCNDKDRTIYPGAVEQCNDGIDQNCDGTDATCTFGANEINAT